MRLIFHIYVRYIMWLPCSTIVLAFPLQIALQHRLIILLFLHLLASGLLIRIAGHRHQVDTIPRARSIRQVVAQVSAIHTDRFTVGENSYVIPNYLGISERWPPVHLALQQKLRHGPPAGGNEQRLASVGIIKGNLLSLLSLLALLPEGCLLKVSTVLGVLRFVYVQMGGGHMLAKS